MRGSLEGRSDGEQTRKGAWWATAATGLEATHLRSVRPRGGSGGSGLAMMFPTSLTADRGPSYPAQRMPSW